MARGPRRPAPPVRFENPETEVRWRKAREGVAGQESFIQRATEHLKYVAAGFRRHYINLPETARFADVSQQLRKLEAAPQVSKENIVRILRGLTDGMTPADLDLFTRKVVLDDLAWESEQDHALPFGFTPESVTAELARLDAALAERPDLVEKVRARKMIVTSVARQLVDAGVLRREQVRNPAYYRHQVLDYARAEIAAARSGGQKLRTPRWASRAGSSLDINANLLEAEFDWLHKAFINIAEARTIEWIKRSGHNVRDQVVAAVKASNARHLQTRLDRDAEKAGYVTPTGRQTSPLAEELMRFRQRIAMGLEQVRAAIESGSLGDIPAEYRGTADALLDEDRHDDGRLYQFLAWMLDNDKPGAAGAAMAFKAVSGRRAFVKDLLGERYIDPTDIDTAVKRGFAPEGYVAWQPEEGRMMFLAKTLPEHVMDRMMRSIEGQIATNLNIPAAEVRGYIAEARTMLAVGGPKYQMVLPEELALTLNSLRSPAAEGPAEALLQAPTRAWKVWTLLNPRRVLKYNLNNLSGDLDAIIAGNPRALRKVGEAAREIYLVAKNRQAPSQNFRDAIERAVFDSGLSIQEIPDVNLLREFAHLTERPGLGRPDKLAVRGLQAYWNATKRWTQYRESVLRYAAYLDYIERIQAGESMEKIGYGASRPSMIDAVTDERDRAALLARDLIGDYGAISAFGQELRRYVLPFWSWTEINLNRYWRLTGNAYSQGVGKGLKTTGVMAAGLGARTTVYLVLRMAALYTLVQLWNNLVFPDDEDDRTTEERARLHLNLSRDENGKVMTLKFQGALSDALAWIGLEDAIAAGAEVEKGRASFWKVLTAIGKAPVNKLANSVTPVISAPYEAATGDKLWPDFFNPRPIRDGWRHIAQTFSVENEYDLIFDRPSRGYARSWKEGLVSARDPGEQAYNRMRGLTFDWLKRVKGRDGGGFGESPTSDALYDYRQAKKFGDRAAERDALDRMNALRMDRDQVKRSVVRAQPLGAIAPKDRSAFLATLTPEERELLPIANRWYIETFAARPEPVE